MRTRIALGVRAPETTARMGGPAPTRAHLHRVANRDDLPLAWAGFAGAPSALDLIDRVSPAAVATAILAGFGFAVGVGSLLFR